MLRSSSSPISWQAEGSGAAETVGSQRSSDLRVTSGQTSTGTSPHLRDDHKKSHPVVATEDDAGCASKSPAIKAAREASAREVDILVTLGTPAHLAAERRSYAGKRCVQLRSCLGIAFMTVLALALTLSFLIAHIVGRMGVPERAADSVIRSPSHKDGEWEALADCPRCTGSLEDLVTYWSCSDVTEGGRGQNEFAFTTSPSLYSACRVEPQVAGAGLEGIEQIPAPTASWMMECEVNCFIVDLAAEQEVLTVGAAASDAAPWTTMSWTAPEHLKRACASRPDKDTRGSVMDYLTFELPATPLSGSASSTLTLSVSYSFETGLIPESDEVLGLFKFAQDHAAMCGVYTSSTYVYCTL